jgi:thioredoxin reductase (NADPH)
MNTQKVVIIGSGPAAYTAAIYAARADLLPVVFEGFYAGPSGGQLMTTTEVENYPGFPDGVMGPDLMVHFKKQAERFGTKCFAEDVQSVVFGERPFTIKGSKTVLQTHSVIIATGATAKRLEIPGASEGEFWQKGVTACAICDGAAPIFRGKDLYVIGGGDSAIEEAIFLTKFASKVYIVHRRNAFRASRIMADRALSHPKIEVIWDHEIVKIEGDQIVRSVIIENVHTKEQKSCVAAGVFFAIGHRPNTDFLGGQVPLETNGYIKVKAGSSETDLEGVFAAGDVQDHKYRQAITAAGSGCMAALDAERWLSHKGFSV